MRIKNSLHLPIETAILVPSTKGQNKKITAKQFKKRVDETRQFLSKSFGGYTSLQGTGGYVSNTKGLIKEQVVMVVSYSQKISFQKKKNQFLNFVKKKGKQWQQEAIGIIIENDLYYINT